MLVDPTLGDLFERRRVQVMQLFAAAPKRDDQVRFDEQAEVFGNALPGHPEMPAKLIQGLAIFVMKLIEKGATAGVSQSFENIVVHRSIMQPNGCIILTKQQISPGKSVFLQAPRPRRLGHALLLEVKRSRSEIDDRVMTFEHLGPQKSHHRRRSQRTLLAVE